MLCATFSPRINPGCAKFTPQRLFAIKLQPVNSADEQTLSLLNNANQTYFVQGQAGEFGLNGSICGYDADTHSLVVSQPPSRVQGIYMYVSPGLLDEGAPRYPHPLEPSPQPHPLRNYDSLIDPRGRSSG